MKYSFLKNEFESAYNKGLISISEELGSFMINLLQTVNPDEDVNESFLFVQALMNGYSEIEYTEIQRFIEYIPENLSMEQAFEKAGRLKAHVADGAEQVTLWLTNESNQTAGELLIAPYNSDCGSKQEYMKYVSDAISQFRSKFAAKLDTASFEKAKAEMLELLKGDGEWVNVMFE